jgi:hypothetical protein
VRRGISGMVFGYEEVLTAISFMAHPETLLPMPEIDDPVLRFVSVVKFYLSGWHIKPPYA